MNDPNSPPFIDSNNNVVVPPQMDEDYDAADNENWFLALVNADKSVIIPSFHRPGNIIYNPANAGVENDWASPALDSQSKFLRPRKQDHPLSGNSFPDLIPDPTTGKITYDVDNDADGTPDSVWVDLGYPVQRDASGRLYKPLFSFMVQGLNGRLPLNTAGNLNQIGYDATAKVGQHIAAHASHLGTSPNEVNPEYALSTGAPFAASGLANLQLLLQGHPSGTVEGRWGEAGVIKASIALGINPPLYPRAGPVVPAQRLHQRRDGELGQARHVRLELRRPGLLPERARGHRDLPRERRPPRPGQPHAASLRAAPPPWSRRST